MNKKTLVIGASLHKERYANKVICKLREKAIDVVAIGAKKGIVADVIIETAKVDFESIDTVTLYLNPNVQKEYYEYIIALQPKRVIFNPGTESLEFVALLQKNGIETAIACTLVLLATNQY